MTDLPVGAAQVRNSHVWNRHEHDWYQEPPWCSRRLFEAEPFTGAVLDPCCGGGNIVEAARAHGHPAHGTDIADRGYGETGIDFLAGTLDRVDNVVCNPPFKVAPQFVARALELARYKVAIIFPTARLNAARWLQALPLARVWLLTPRPSMPPGEVILRGEKPGNGKEDFCWVVLEHGHRGPAAMHWLHRDRR
jgi:hypothetical protein